VQERWCSGAARPLGRGGDEGAPNGIWVKVRHGGLENWWALQRREDCATLPPPWEQRHAPLRFKKSRALTLAHSSAPVAPFSDSHERPSAGDGPQKPEGLDRGAQHKSNPAEASPWLELLCAEEERGGEQKSTHKHTRIHKHTRTHAHAHTSTQTHTNTHTRTKSQLREAVVYGRPEEILPLLRDGANVDFNDEQFKGK
jgi:hypothetical protein